MWKELLLVTNPHTFITNCYEAVFFIICFGFTAWIFVTEQFFSQLV